MKRFKDIAFITFISYTLLMLAGLVVLTAAAGAFGANASGDETIKAFAEDLANLGFAVFVYSALIGASFLIFDIKRLSPFWKRAMHLVVNYAVMLALFIVLTMGHTGQGLMAFVLTFVFIVVYFAGMLICRGLKKLDMVLEEIKKSKKI